MASQERPVQFTVRTLLLMMLVTAVVLGSFPWFGPELLTLLAAAIATWSLLRIKTRFLLVWLVPVWWAVCAFGAWHHPGDEYGMFVVSVLPAIWIAFLLNYTHLSSVYLLLITCGMLPMAVFGLMLDLLRIPRRLFLAVYPVAALAWLAALLWQYPSMEAAIAKNGSRFAYVLCAANLGLYSTLVLFVVFGGVFRAFSRLFRGQPSREDACL